MSKIRQFFHQSRFFRSSVFSWRRSRPVLSGWHPWICCAPCMFDEECPGVHEGFHKKSAMRVALVEIDEGRNHRPIATWNRSVLTGEFFPAAPRCVEARAESLVQLGESSAAKAFQGHQWRLATQRNQPEDATSPFQCALTTKSGGVRGPCNTGSHGFGHPCDGLLHQWDSAFDLISRAVMADFGQN